MLCWSGSTSCVDLRAALGAGDDDLALAHRDAADGLAVPAGEILVGLVGAALLCASEPALHGVPPCQKFRVFCPALHEIFGKCAPQKYRREDGHEDVLDVVDDAAFRNGGDDGTEEPDDQVGDQDGHVELIGSVASVHEAHEGALEFVKEVSHRYYLDSEVSSMNCRGKI